MEITIDLIEHTLSQEGLNQQMRIELEWDVWILRGSCKHGYSYSNLTAAKLEMELCGEGPTSYARVRQEATV